MTLQDKIKLVQRNPIHLQKICPLDDDYSDIALAAIDKNPIALKYVSPEFENYEKIVSKRLCENPESIQYVNSYHKSYKNLALHALRINMSYRHELRNAYKFIDQSVKEDIDFLYICWLQKKLTINEDFTFDGREHSDKVLTDEVYVNALKESIRMACYNQIKWIKDGIGGVFSRTVVSTELLDQVKNSAIEKLALLNQAIYYANNTSVSPQEALDEINNLFTTK